MAFQFKPGLLGLTWPLAMLISTSLALANSPEKPENPPEQGGSQAQAGGPEDGAVVLQADPEGHFSGTLRINNVSMPFIIDTGATMTTIPMKLALAARLPFGRQIEIMTAGGKAYGKTTLIGSMRLGALEIKNIPAHLNEHLSEVLIGMNALKFFRISQTADQLSLSINQEMLNKEARNAGVSINMVTEKSSASLEPAGENSPAKPISKSVVCDMANNCVTRYGN